MAWSAVGVERFRSYREYQEMMENLTAVQVRCNELSQDVRVLRAHLAEPIPPRNSTRRPSVAKAQ